MDREVDDPQRLVHPHPAADQTEADRLVQGDDLPEPRLHSRQDLERTSVAFLLKLAELAKPQAINPGRVRPGQFDRSVARHGYAAAGTQVTAPCEARAISADTSSPRSPVTP